MDLAEAVQAVIAKLVAAEVRAAADLRDLNPPGVLVRPPELEWRFKDGSWDASWTLWAIVPDVGTVKALEALSMLLARAQVALDGRVLEARPIDVQALDGAGTLPAYELTYTQRIK